MTEDFVVPLKVLEFSAERDYIKRTPTPQGTVENEPSNSWKMGIKIQGLTNKQVHDIVDFFRDQKILPPLNTTEEDREIALKLLKGKES